MKIGIILKRYRMWRDFGVREFASMIGISAATLSRIENGGSVDQKTMLKLINYLFGEE